MNANEYWKALCTKNKSFSANEKVTIKTSILKKIVEQAHKKGVLWCNEINNDYKDFQKNNIFNDIFK